MEIHGPIIQLNEFPSVAKFAAIFGGAVFGTIFMNDALKDHKNSSVAIKLVVGTFAGISGIIVGGITGIVALATSPLLIPIAAGTLAYRYIDDN